VRAESKRPVDHPLPSYSPWRARAMVASVVAALELVALVAVGAAAVGPSLVADLEGAARAHELAPVATSPKPARGKPRPLLDRTDTSVVVLNGNGVAGAASDSADRVRELSYVVANVGNSPRRNEGRTVVMYRPGFEGEARRLAKDLGVKLVGPLDGLRAPDLMGAHLAVVVGH
jgi:LytR cell envelope-related transcriptional attenuator